MTDHIVTAAMAWYAQHIQRLELTTAKRKADLRYVASCASTDRRTAAEIGERLTTTKRLEAGALRQLAKACQRTVISGEGAQ